MKRSVEILIILLLYCQIRLSFELFSKVGLESLGIIMITFSPLEPLDQKKRQAVAGVSLGSLRQLQLPGYEQWLLVRRRCFACAQCGPCLLWIPLKKKHLLYSFYVFSLAKILKISETSGLRLVSYLLAD